MASKDKIINSDINTGNIGNNGNKGVNGILKYLSANRILLKAKYSFYSALVFFVFANPETHSILQQLFFRNITINGHLNMYGLIITSVLFFITMLGLMLIPDL